MIKNIIKATAGKVAQILGKDVGKLGISKDQLGNAVNRAVDLYDPKKTPTQVGREFVSSSLNDLKKKGISKEQIDQLMDSNVGKNLRNMAKPLLGGKDLKDAFNELSGNNVSPVKNDANVNKNAYNPVLQRFGRK